MFISVCLLDERFELGQHLVNLVKVFLSSIVFLGVSLEYFDELCKLLGRNVLLCINLFFGINRYLVSL